MSINKKACLSLIPIFYKIEIKVCQAKLKQYPFVYSITHVTLMSPCGEVGTELGTEAIKRNKAAP